MDEERGGNETGSIGRQVDDEFVPGVPRSLSVGGSGAEGGLHGQRVSFPCTVNLSFW